MYRAALLAAVVAGCSFQHGVVPGADSGGGNGGGGSDGSLAGTDARSDGTAGSTAHVRMLDIDDTRVTGGPHTDFPLLVSITQPWLRTAAMGGEVARADGFDIYFSADQAGATRLAHEVEVYTPATGTLVAWVKLPSLSPQTVLYLHYGDTTVTTDSQNVHAVWSGGFAGVFHQRTLADATGNSAQLQSTASGTAGGEIDLATTFDGIDDQVSLGSATALDNIFVGGGTAEAWFYARTWGENGFGRIFDKGHVSGWSLTVDNTDAPASVVFLHGTTTGGWGFWTANNSVTLNAWHHVALVYDKNLTANDPAIYIDGRAVTVTRDTGPNAALVSDATVALTEGNRSALDRTFDGFLDELRLSSGSRSAGWIATEVKNQAEPSQFFAIGPEL
jgi:hypothetical protein